MGAGHSSLKKRCKLALMRSIFDETEWDKYPEGISLHLSDLLIYHPLTPINAREKVCTPEEFNLPYEEVYITTEDDIKIHSYLLKQYTDDVSESSATIISFHGNAGNIGHKLLSLASLFRQSKCHMLVVEYRGYGLSQGTPSEKGLYKDALAAFKYVQSRNDLDPTKIFIFGSSLGGAVTIDLAVRTEVREKLKGLIIENTFTSIPDLATFYLGQAFRHVPIGFFKNKFESSRKIKAVVCPTLFISGLEDDVIPPEMMQELSVKCGSSFVRTHTFDGGDHNNTWKCDDYCKVIVDFIAQSMGHTSGNFPVPVYKKPSRILSKAKFL